VPRLARDGNRHVVQAGAGMLGWLRDGEMFAERLRPKYAKLVRDVFGKRARALGWAPRKDDDEDTRILRGALVPLVADQGEDRVLSSEAVRLADAWTKDHRAIDPELVNAVLAIAAKRGDRALFDRWHELARGEKDSSVRQRLLGAMGGFSDPDIIRAAYAIILTDEFDARESARLLFGAMRTPRTARLAYAFVKENYDALSRRVPRDWAAGFPFAGTATCDESLAADMVLFFEDRSAEVEGGPRLLSQAIESLRLCAAFREAQRPNVERFLAIRRSD